MTAPHRAKRGLPAIVAPPDVDAAAFGGEVVPAPIPLGHSEVGDPVGFDLDRLIDGRLLVQGMSGAGKSWLLRRLLESTAARIQQIILDPEGEFASLAEHFGYEAIDAARFDATALKHVAARARRHRISLWVDLSQIDVDRQLAAVAALLSTLVMAPGDDWHPCLVAVDEAHLFAPQGSGPGATSALRRASVEAMTDLMSRGRKRGLCAVLATQRLVKLSRSVASEAGNVLIGRNISEVDISRAALSIGWQDRKAQGMLPSLPAGRFVAVGPAFTRSPTMIDVGPVLTRHRGSTPRIGEPPPRHEDPGALLELDELQAASEVRTLAGRSGVDPRHVDAIRRFAVEAGFVAAARILGELRAIAPLPSAPARLSRALEMRRDAVEAGLELLDAYGLIQSSANAGERNVWVWR